MCDVTSGSAELQAANMPENLFPVLFIIHRHKKENTWFDFVSNQVFFLVAGAGFEPTTSGLWEPLSQVKELKKLNKSREGLLKSADELATNGLKTSLFVSSVGSLTEAAIQILGQISGGNTHHQETRGENSLSQGPKTKNQKPWLTAQKSRIP